MNNIENEDRRYFLKTIGTIGAGLTIGVYLTGCDRSIDGLNEYFEPNAWIRISLDNLINISISKAEMGQGISTALAMMIAEELDANWDNVRISQAEVHQKYGLMYTAGSTSTKEMWMPLRKAGASARLMLIQAAAKKWNTQAEQLYTENSHVVSRLTGKKITYGELSLTASASNIPEEPKLKAEHEFRIIGQPLPRLDAEKKVTGAAKYGIDVELPALKYAAIRHAPVFGSVPLTINSENISGISGVRAIVKLDNAVSVVADSYWQAESLLKRLDITWSDSSVRDINDTKIRSEYKILSTKDGEIFNEKGKHVPDDIDFSLEAEYESPFQAHATMEPMNCTAYVDGSACKIWAPTQNPQKAKSTAVSLLRSKLLRTIDKISNKLNIDTESVQVYPTLIGGGFGRRLDQDYVEQAVLISKECGYPVKLIWSREEDIKHDFYRPYTWHRIKADFTRDGDLLNWQHRIVGPTRGKCVGGAISLPYDYKYLKVDYHVKELGIPLGAWRSVGYSHNIFVMESFIDEIAYKLNIDPVEYRLSRLDNNPQVKKVLLKVAEMANWKNRNRIKGKGFGVAISVGFDSVVAQIAEVTVASESGRISVDRVFCAIDSGMVINPSIVESQLQSAIVFGITATIKSGININNGQVVQSNFNDFQLLRFDEMPIIETAIVENMDRVGGVGEIGVPAIAPAITNAIFEASGYRVRSLPIKSLKYLI